MKRLLARLALLLVGSALALVLAEGAVRLLRPQPFVTGKLRWEEHPRLGFRLQPSLDVPGELGGHVNALGLRGAEIEPKAEEEWRVLVIGDSFTYGAGVAEPECFPRRLEGLLAARDDVVPEGRRVTCVNAGTVGYGTRQQLIWLEEYAEPLDADELLLAVFVGNDFSDNRDISRPTIIDGQRVRGDPGESEWSLRLRLARNESHLYRWWRKRNYDGPRAEAPKNTQDRPAAVDRGLGARIALYAAPGKAPARLVDDVEAGYVATGEALDGVLAWCRERELPLKVVIIADILQVDGQVAKRVVETFPALEGHVVRDRPQRYVVDWCEANQVPVLDLLLPMIEITRQRGHSLHLGYDPHWNAEGHQVAAELMAERLWPAD